jgi:cytochrome c-type protein NapB
MGDSRGPSPIMLGVLAAALLLGGMALLFFKRGEDRRYVDVPGRTGQYKTLAALRAGRRAYDGAPPVVPHPTFNMACIACHTDQGMFVPNVGFAPAMPHLETPGLSRASNCRQCHVFRETEAVWVSSDFEGRPQDLRRGSRMYPHAPPVIPHAVFMREACAACHSGPAAREEMRCTHPERLRCAQCHVPSVPADDFPLPQ